MAEGRDSTTAPQSTTFLRHSVSRIACTAPLILCIVLFCPTGVPGQNVQERAAIESVMIEALDLPVATRRHPPDLKACHAFERALRNVCEGILYVTSGGFVPMGDRLTIPGGIGDTLAYCTATLRAGDHAAAGRSAFWFANRERPQWGTPFYGMALVELDSKLRPDSALKLLAMARRLGGVSEGVLALAEARAHYARNDGGKGWERFVSALSDSSLVAQTLVRAVAWPLIPVHLQRDWEATPVAERDEWLRRQPAIRRLIQQGIVPTFLEKCLDVRIRGYAAWRRSPIMVIPYALGGGHLKIDTVSTKPMTQEYHYRIRIEAVRDEDGIVFVQDTVRTYRLPEPIREGGQIRLDDGLNRPAALPGMSNGMITQGATYGQSGPSHEYRLLSGTELPLPPGRYTVTVVISQDAARRGITKTLPTLVIPDTATVGLDASDLLLGWEGHGLPWNGLTAPVRLNPFGLWDREGVLTLFMQLRGLHPSAAYETSIRIFRHHPKSGLDSLPAVSVRFNERGDSATRFGITEWRRTLETRHLADGEYCLQVVVAQGNRLVRRADPVVIAEGAAIDDEAYRKRYGRRARPVASTQLGVACTSLREGP